MAIAQMDTLIRHLRRTVLRQDAAGRTDGQLLASFIDQKDEAAFEAQSVVGPAKGAGSQLAARSRPPHCHESESHDCEAARPGEAGDGDARTRNGPTRPMA